MTAAPRVSLPPTTVAAQSELGTVALDAESLRLHQAGMHATHPKGPHGIDSGGDQGGDDEGGFTDSSSDFSYGSSDGSADVDAEERKVLRQARRALQVARKEARQVSHKVCPPPRFHAHTMALAKPMTGLARLVRCVHGSACTLCLDPVNARAACSVRLKHGCTR